MSATLEHSLSGWYSDLAYRLHLPVRNVTIVRPPSIVFHTVLGLLAIIATAGRAVETPPKPNIIFILTDDMGYGDPSCYGNREVKTPNIDRLARDGLRLAQFYVASPICSPSRVALTTGSYPARWRINDYLHDRAGNRHSEQVDWLDPQAPTLARTLKAAGYATGHFGKWHMGGGRDVQDAPWPSAYGFDEHFVNCEGMGPRIPGFGCQGPEQVEGRALPRYRFTEFYVDKTIDFIRRHRARPFLVNLWPMDVHDPHMADPEVFPRYAGVLKGHQNFDAVLDEYDRQIGRLLDFLKQSGLEKNTIVLLTSDNGPNPSFDHQRTAGLRGQKWSLYEGGVREPLIIRWPGRVPAGRID
jgi:arylsulfatase A-like enzyme